MDRVDQVYRAGSSERKVCPNISISCTPSGRGLDKDHLDSSFAMESGGRGQGQKGGCRDSQ